LDKVHVLGSDFQSDLLEYIDADSLPDFLGGTCKCEHMPGGCVPIIPDKSSKFKITSQNEKVPTVYNSVVMKAAISNNNFCSLTETENKQL
jgi:hypothetical protein